MKNARDLMTPFRRKDIYHWQFSGPYSIKAVLPALVPELSYKELAISNGEMAANTWLRMHQEGNNGQNGSNCLNTAIWIRWQWLRFWRRCGD